MNANDNMVKELNIIDATANIFSNDRYVVPLYQRGYAWEEKHIVQLIDDVMDISSSGHYYIGTLIVHRRMDAFEVIDGQQRLTTLFLLLRFLDLLQPDELSSLRFDCRDKSNYTLDHLQILDNGVSSGLINDNNIQQELLSGYNIIKDRLKNVDDITILTANLRRTIIYRVEVPAHTDLNHYFEIMNTRGEQLEQSDVLKARLMERLQGDKKWQVIFATIWDACRNMDGYVQMNFNKNIREKIFGSYWNEMPEPKLGNYSDLPIEDRQTAGHFLKEAINYNFKVNLVNENNEEDKKRRFESIIDFPYFLLHTLRVYVHSYNVTPSTDLLDTMLDDKKLAEAFERVICNGEINGKPIRPKSFVKKFAICMLRTRYLFDSYIIKREYTGDASQDGEWSLKALHSSGQGPQKKALYTLSNVVAYYGRDNDLHNKNILMLQAALRVSYTSPKVMHWITDLLIWLTDQYNNSGDESWNLEEIVDSIAKKPVVEFLMNKENFYLGVKTSHIVLNYLDFLLWKEDRSQDFDFEFRNSVEHWYPRNPSEGSFSRWEDDGADGVNRFGNLCLIQRNINSRFSNMHPGAKKTTFQDMIGKGSLKLRKMSEMTTDNSMQWRETTCSEHENEMIDILKQACGI